MIPIYVEIYICVLLVFIGLWILIDAMLDTWEAEHQVLISQLEEQEKHALQTKVKVLEERYQEMLKSRKVVHDMKNHILALKNYDQEQNWPGLHEYLNELSNDMLEYNFHVWTGNHMIILVLLIVVHFFSLSYLVVQTAELLPLDQYRSQYPYDVIWITEKDNKGYNYQIWTGNRMLDMILNEKSKEAKDKKIDMQINTEVFTTLPFTDREIISLFGNLLDNAIEACERITDKNTWIHIKMKKKNQLLYFEIKNTTETTVQQVPGKFITTKTDGTLHGYGIKNIMDVVEKYHGIFQSQMVEDYFVVMISVYADICID